MEFIAGDTIAYNEKELLKKASESNPQVEKYIKSGIPRKDWFNKSNNKRTRYILERLRVRYAEIKAISKRPTTLKWITKVSNNENYSDHSDHSDHSDSPRTKTSIRCLPEQNTRNAKSEKEIPNSGDENTVTRSDATLHSRSERSERSERIQKRAKIIGLPGNTNRSNSDGHCTNCYDSSENTEKLHVMRLMLKDIDRAGESTVSLPELLRALHASSERVRNFIGDKITRNENQKVRELFRDIVRHKNIEPIETEPQLLVRWKKSETKDSHYKGNVYQ
jgi:hypothetical protein